MAFFELRGLFYGEHCGEVGEDVRDEAVVRGFAALAIFHVEHHDVHAVGWFGRVGSVDRDLVRGVGVQSVEWVLGIAEGECCSIGSGKLVYCSQDG